MHNYIPIAQVVDDVVTVKNRKSIPELGILCGLHDADETILNDAGYYFTEDVEYDSVMQTLGLWAIDEDNKARRPIISKEFDIDDEKVKKIQRADGKCKTDVHNMVYLDMEKNFFDPSHEMPEEVSVARLARIAAFNGIKDEINALVTAEEVVKFVI